MHWLRPASRASRPPAREAIGDHVTLGDEVALRFEGDYAGLKRYGGVFAAVVAAAVLLVFGVMAAQFESFSDPLIIFFAIPLTFVDVIAAHYLLAVSISLFSALGFVMLLGMAVDNGIGAALLLTLCLVPVLYAALNRYTERWWPSRAKLESRAAPPKLPPRCSSHCGTAKRPVSYGNDERTACRKPGKSAYKEETMSVQSIRPMQQDEQRALKRLARRAFGFVQGSFVKPTEHTFVYELSGEIAGVVVLDTFTFKRNRLGGVVKWLFTDPRARGRGVAAALIEHSVRQLQEHGCDELFTTVEGCNTASSNRFADQGFVPLSAMQQIRRYGMSLLKIGPNTFHTIDLGHFLWARAGQTPRSPEAPESPQGTQTPVPGGGAAAWLANVLIAAAILPLQRLRAGAASELYLELVWQLPVAVALVFGVRSLAMKLAAHRLGLELRYRIWETGLTLSALVAVLLSGVLPSPGSYYPKPARWSYRAELPRLAIVAFFGALSVLVLAWLLGAYEAAALGSSAPAVVNDLLRLAVVPVQALLVFEVLLPFFPFASYNGRRVWDHDRALWGILAAGTVALLLVRSTGI